MQTSLGVLSKGKGYRHWITVAFVTAIVAMVPRSLMAQGFSRLSVPLPVAIDGQAVRSKLYLKVEMKTYNESFDQFAASQSSKSEAIFVKAVEAVRKNDVAAFGSVWTAPDEMKSTGPSMVVKMSDNGPDGWMKLIRGMFDFDKLSVVAEILVGPDTVFMWDSQTKNGVLRRALYVGLDKNGRQRLSAPGDNKPVEALLLNAFTAAQKDPESYRPLLDVNLRNQYPIPLEGAGASAHPVFLVFDGSPVDFPLTDERVAAPSPLLKFYRDAALANRNGMTEQFAASFTAKSSEKVKEWQAATAEMKKRRESEQKNQPSKLSPNAGLPSITAAAPDAKTLSKLRAHVKFVLNADPVYLVFQATGQGNDWKPADLAYTYVVSEAGSYKLANFGYQNTLDVLLQNPALFDKRILKPAPAKPGAQKTKVVPAPAKSAGAKK